MTESATSRPPRTRMPLSFWIVGVTLPLVVGAAAVGLQLAWLPQLPDPIAIHWSAGGPDGFAPAWTIVALTAGLAVGLTGMFAGFLGTARGSAPSATHKFLAVTSLVVGIFIGVTVTASVAVQRGLDDARGAGPIDGWMLVGLAIAAVVGVVAWFVLPKAVRQGTDATPAEPLRLAPGERGTWIATTRIATAAMVVIMAAMVLVFAASAFAIALTDGRAWPVGLAPLLLVAIAALGIAWRVRVDATGLLVRSLPFGWPRLRIRVADIARVSASHIEPLAEFGGWGWRWAPGGGFGVVARSGEAIEVVRRDGRRFVVTVDDAETGAALLAAFAASAPETGERGPQTGSARGNR